MKLILSRKGFDSSQRNGRVASPILPDGRLISLPIPEKTANPLSPPYADLTAQGVNLGQLVEDLTGRKITRDQRAHLDPDLNRDILPDRPAGWRPLFGQQAATETHLQRQEVGPGDIFLFFGWFREVELVDGHYCYGPDSADRHVLFGWLQIGERVRLGRQEPPDWARRHPHTRPEFYHATNSLYLSAPRLQLPGRKADRPGAGVFPHYHPRLCLTAPGYSRSFWQLPGWFHPQGRQSALSYHGRLSRWQRAGDQVILQTVGQGQEFVLDMDHYPEARDWLMEFFG